LIKLKKGVSGVAALLLQYWGSPMASGVSSDYEGDTHSDTSSRERAHRRHH